METLFSSRNRWYFEIWLSWRFIRNDIWTTLIPLTLLTTGLSINLSLNTTDVLVNTLLALIYFFIFDYIFEINSQIFGIEEDRINKPDRPIAAGIITPEGAKQRAIIILCGFTIYAFLLNVLLWALIWFGLVWLYSYTNWSKNWLLKCLLVSLGTLTQLPVAATIAGFPIMDLSLWLATIFVVMTIMIGVQEFRDVEGDLAVDRKTLPIVFGVKNARRMIAAASVISIIILHFTLFNRHSEWPLSRLNMLFEVASAALLLSVFFRMLQNSVSRSHDHFSFRLFEYWYTLICISVISYSF